jgi:hypothetical protein
MQQLNRISHSLRGRGSGETVNLPRKKRDVNDHSPPFSVDSSLPSSSLSSEKHLAAGIVVQQVKEIPATRTKESTPASGRAAHDENVSNLADSNSHLLNIIAAKTDGSLFDGKDSSVEKNDTRDSPTQLEEVSPKEGAVNTRATLASCI